MSDGNESDFVRRIAEPPRMDRPVLIAAFEGWNDAGDAATTAANYVARAWGAEVFAEIDPEEFYDFSTSRPLVHLDDDDNRSIVWPENTFAAATGGPRDVIVLAGIEPQLRWRTFCGEIIEVARHHGASLVVTLGALLAEVPHTRPSPVYGSTDSPELRHLSLQRSSYEGPTGIVGVLHDQCRTAGLTSASLWAAVPSYVPAAPSPKAALAIVERLGQVLDASFVTTDLEIAASSYEHQVSELVAEDDDTTEYVRELERQHDEGSLEPPSADELVADIEEFLRDK